VETQELKWWHVRWRPAARLLSRAAVVGGKLLGFLCVVSAVGFGVIYLISPWLSARRMGEYDPRLKLVPVSLPSNADAPLSYSSVEHFGFKFLLPSGAFRDGAETADMTMMWFHDGGLEFHNPSDQEDWSLLKIIQDDENAEKLLGKEILHSKFLLLQAAMSTTPEQVKWWRFRSSRNERAHLLLLVKSLALIGAVSSHPFTISPIYTVTAGNIRGFQFGNPNAAPYEVHLDLFDKTDRHLRFDISGLGRHGPLLTQRELNVMVASIQSVSER
jgi:hypothetical protein